jgi:sulfur-carrier protein
VESTIRIGSVAVVRLRGPLKGLAGGRSEQSVEAATVGDLLSSLERMHPAMGGWILDERGAIRRHINVFVNGERVGAEAAVGDEDRVDVLPAISGGSRR